jgi:hypothetical protein
MKGAPFRIREALLMCADEDIQTYNVSDEALEAAAGAVHGGARSNPTFPCPASR